MCTMAMAVESLRRGDELGEGKEKTKDILDVCKDHTRSHCGGSWPAQWHSCMAQSRAALTWRDPRASQALETLEEQWNTKTKPSLPRAWPKVLQAKPHPMLRALSGTPCRVRTQKQIPWEFLINILCSSMSCTTPSTTISKLAFLKERIVILSRQ